MKTPKIFTLGMIFLVLCGFQVLAKKGTQSNNPDDPNYVVIGAFSVYEHAVNFTAKASQLSFDAKYAMNKDRNLYYVYVLFTNDREQAKEEAIRLRKESPYNDAWVFHGDFTKPGAKNEDVNPVTEQPITEVKPEETKPAETKPAEIVATVQTTKKEEKPDQKDFFFKIVRADNRALIENAEVNVVDVERSRKMGTFVGNKGVSVSDPKSKEGSISLVCEVFGYRKLQRDINYRTPQGDGIEVSDSATVVPFEMVRLTKGDIAVMYNVFFFKDAALMRPESRNEVNSLLEMLKENPKMKVLIHGHTNGGSAGKIIYAKDGSTDFFSLNDTKEGVGSAKQLSQARAEVIRDFLLSNGIEAGRMEVKAWGGKKPLYDKNSAQAQSNVRVEIEVLDN